MPKNDASLTIVNGNFGVGGGFFVRVVVVCVCAICFLLFGEGGVLFCEELGRGRGGGLLFWWLFGSSFFHVQIHA